MALRGLSLALLAVVSGCFWVTTKSEGESLRKDVTTLQGQIAAKQQDLDSKIKQLDATLDKATKLLTRNNADIGADVEALRVDVATAKGLVVSVNNSINEMKTAFDKYRKDNDARMDSLEQRVGQIESGKPSANSSPDDLWRLGSEAFEAARYNDAVDIYRRLVQTYPTHEKAPDAQYFIGQAYSKQQDWDKAIDAYHKLLEKYPQSSVADDGLYMAALAAQALKNCNEARSYLSFIKSKYPKSNVLKQSAELDAQIKKDLKNKAKCSS